MSAKLASRVSVHIFPSVNVRTRLQKRPNWEQLALAALEASGLECEAPGDLHRQKWPSSYSGHAQLPRGSPHM